MLVKQQYYDSGRNITRADHISFIYFCRNVEKFVCKRSLMTTTACNYFRTKEFMNRIVLFM